MGAKKEVTLQARIAKRLKRQLRGYGRKQADLVRLTGLNQPTVSRYLDEENDSEPKLSQLLIIGDALGMTIAQIIGKETPPPLLLRRRDQEVVEAYHGDPSLKDIIDSRIPHVPDPNEEED